MKQRWIRVEHRQFVAINSLFTSRVMPGLNQFVHVLLRNRAGIESAFGSWGFPGAGSGCQSGLAADGGALRRAVIGGLLELSR